MATLNILSKNDIQTGRKLRQDYHAWSQSLKWRDLPADYFPTIKLPKGQESETLRNIIVEARMKENLSLRFWWAVQLANGDTSLFLSLKDIDACDQFADICDRHCAQTLG